MRSIAARALLACFTARFLWTRSSSGGSVHELDGNASPHRRQTSATLDQDKDLIDVAAEVPSVEAPDEFRVCGRTAADPPASDATSPAALRQSYTSCREGGPDPQTPTLVIDGHHTFGRTGNHINAFLLALQYARDRGDIQLGITYKSWAMDVVASMWMVRGDAEDWVPKFEEAFCIKVFRSRGELRGWTKVPVDSRSLFQHLFYYRSPSPQEEYAASQQHIMRTLFQHYNTGDGLDHRGNPVRDMCSGIDSVFGEDHRSSAVYSVIHLRYLEKEPGFRFLGQQSRATGCDPVAALEMWPDYVKSILAPTGMMERPIVVITDGQNAAALKRLLGDPDIGPMLHVVPEEGLFIGGDFTLAVMSDVFIGNPASSFSKFIARTRVSLGLGSNYLWRAKDKKGEWSTVCGDSCLFRLPQKVFFWDGWPQTRSPNKTLLENQISREERSMAAAREAAAKPFDWKRDWKTKEEEARIFEDQWQTGTWKTRQELEFALKRMRGIPFKTPPAETYRQTRMKILEQQSRPHE